MIVEELQLIQTHRTPCEHTVVREVFGSRVFNEEPQLRLRMSTLVSPSFLLTISELERRERRIPMCVNI